MKNYPRLDVFCLLVPGSGMLPQTYIQSAAVYKWRPESSATLRALRESGCYVSPF